MRKESEKERVWSDNGGQGKVADLQIILGLCYRGRTRSASLVYHCGFIICVLFSITNKFGDTLK